jgi:hypothetical protein
MSNYPVGRRPRSADPQSKLRLAALTAVIAGVVLLAAAAFVLSYSGIHLVALQAGVAPRLAKLYPVIFDAMLVIAGAAAMALRGAGWWSRFYAWACLILLLAAVATGDAVHATNTKLPERASRAAVAITPWVLLLLAFGLLLAMLRYFRKARVAVAARQEARAAAGAGGKPGEANGVAGGRTAVTWAAAGAAGTAGPAEGRPLPPPRASLDTLLEPKTGQEPAAEAAPYQAGAEAGAEADDGTGQHGDPVSYGEETGYVHPDSYQDEGEYSPHGDSGGPGSYGGYPGQDEPSGDDAGIGGYAPRHGPGEAAEAGEDGEQGPADAGPADAAPGGIPAVEPAQDAVEPARDDDGAADPGSPGLERMWSTPSRPEE